MTADALLSLALFAAIATGTPGPNNLMVMASGANFGLRRTGPHIAGIAVGVAVLILLTGAGIGRAVAALPGLAPVLSVAAGLYLLWLAWKIATAAPPRPGADPGRPFTFLQAAGFQWVNPKAWAMALTAISVYVPAGGSGAAALVFALVAVPLVTMWCVAGGALGRLLSTRRRLRAFNITMAILLVLSPLPALL